MDLEIITPEKSAYSAKVKLVQLPGSLGSFEIMKNHAPMISTLSAGKLKAVPFSGEPVFFEIGDGVVEVSGNKIIILTEKA
jgi:F-type H+-transporting ATPase subunit epsilon